MTLFALSSVSSLAMITDSHNFPFSSPYVVLSQVVRKFLSLVQLLFFYLISTYIRIWKILATRRCVLCCVQAAAAAAVTVLLWLFISFPLALFGCNVKRQSIYATYARTDEHTIQNQIVQSHTIFAFARCQSNWMFHHHKCSTHNISS